MNDLIKELAKAVKKVKTSAYDTAATVMRLDGDTVYVHIEGGAEETPVQKTISCKKGDKVKIRVSGGKAWITGNFTSPPTDDTATDEQARVFEKKMGSMSSAITQTAKEISLKVSKGDVISSINQTAETVKIKAEKIQFDGNTDINGNVVIGGKDNFDGTLTVKNASGETVGTWTKDGIYTVSGQVGGWVIKETTIEIDDQKVEDDTTGGKIETKTSLSLGSTDKSIDGKITENYFLADGTSTKTVIIESHHRPDAFYALRDEHDVTAKTIATYENGLDADGFSATYVKQNDGESAYLENTGSQLKPDALVLRDDIADTYAKITSHNLSVCHAGLAIHGYGNTAVSTSTTNNDYKKMPAFTTNSKNSDLVTVKDNYQISVKKGGIYQISVRLQVTCANAFKRAYLAPFVEDSRVAAQTTNIYTPVANATYTVLENFTLELSAYDVVDFRIAAQEAVSVTATIADVQVFVLDYKNKYSSL